jgi:hypothetical protein
MVQIEGDGSSGETRKSLDCEGNSQPGKHAVDAHRKVGPLVILPPTCMPEPVIATGLPSLTKWYSSWNEGGTKMTDDIVPDWVKRKKREKEAVERENSEERERQSKDAKVIALEGVAFWKRFIKALEFNAAASKDLGIRATVSPTGTEPTGREGFQINVVMQGLIPRQNYLNVFYSPGSGRIECYPPEGEEYQIDLLVDSREEISAGSKRRSNYATAEQLAEDIVEELAESVGG